MVLDDSNPVPGVILRSPCRVIRFPLVNVRLGLPAKVVELSLNWMELSGVPGDPPESESTYALLAASLFDIGLLSPLRIQGWLESPSIWRTLAVGPVSGTNSLAI